MGERLAAPIEPPPTPWRFPSPVGAPEDLVATGADLAPGTLLAAYRAGYFPMHVDRRRRVLGWWSPDPRGVIPLDALVVSRSLRRSVRRYQVSVDMAFDEVIRACRTVRRPGGWITAEIDGAYRTLHRLGWAHSVEVWDGAALVGGLYGVGIGALFAGESMFHRATDASKVALVALVELLGDAGADALLDVQWVTPHLASLGAVGLARGEYLARLGVAVGQVPPAALSPKKGRPNASRVAGVADD